MQEGRGVIIKVFRTRKEWGKKPREELYSLDLAYRDPRVPWCAKLFIACVVDYGFSPTDLIPDFVPIIGDLDDPIWVPIEITLALKMIPPSVLAECRDKDRADMRQRKPTHWVAVPGIICIWVLFALLAIFLVTKAIKK